jgi:hypothetical protein
MRLATLLLIAATIIWIAFEGYLPRVLLLSVAGTLLVMIQVIHRILGGTVLSPVGWLLGFTLSGLVAGAGIPLLTLLLMVVKTGLHAHGPEFSAAEFVWVASNIPVWTGGGLLAGAGLALITLALHRT